jgi:hypothetical protein
VNAHTFTKQAEKFETNAICQKADGDCFLGQERSADGGIHATRIHNDFRSVLRNIKRTIQNKIREMLTSGVVLLNDNARPHKAAGTRALLEHFNWELFDHQSYNPDLAPDYYHVFAYLKN